MDLIFGQAGNDSLFGKGGMDFLFGGAGNDSLTGGDGDDQIFGESDNDRLIWNPGDDTDLNEGGDGIDTVEVNGGNGAEIFTVTANGTRVALSTELVRHRFRLTLAQVKILSSMPTAATTRSPPAMGWPP